MVVRATAPSVLPLLGTEFTDLTRRHGVPGAQLAIHHDGHTVTFEVGEREYRTGEPVTRDTVFGIGSITKTVTATTAMILVADGDVELDEPVGEYVRVPDLDERVTLRRLLSHTAGLAAGPDPEQVAMMSLQRYVAQHCSRRALVLPPGAGFSYSNIGYVLVGHLIETVTGMSWQEAVESIVLRPLGIEPALVGASGDPDRPFATGHSVNAASGRTRPVRSLAVPAEAPAGGLAMSATDLVALGLVQLRSGGAEVLAEEYAAQMRQPVAGAEPFGLADGWGLGLAVFGEDDGDWVGHDGNAEGVSCYLRVEPANGWVVALTSNANAGAALWRDLPELLDRAGVPLGRARAQAPLRFPTAPPRGCAGTYVNGDTEYVVVQKNDGNLYLAVDGDAFSRLACYDHLTFTLHDPESGREVLGGRFVRNPATAEIYAIQIGGRLARRRVRTRHPDGGHFTADAA